MSNTQIFIVLYWSWDGDGYLVNKYIDCFSNEQEAVKFCETFAYNQSMIIRKSIKIYLPGDRIPDEDNGDYGTPSFVQIVKKVF